MCFELSISAYSEGGLSSELPSTGKGMKIFPPNTKKNEEKGHIKRDTCDDPNLYVNNGPILSSEFRKRQ